MAHANRAYLVRRKAPVGSNSRRGHPDSGQSDLSGAAGKRKPPRRAAGEVAALLGAEMGRDEPATRRFCAPTKKDGMPVPSSEFGSALWLGPRQPATDPCAWAHYESPEVPRNAVTK